MSEVLPQIKVTSNAQDAIAGAKSGKTSRAEVSSPSSPTANARSLESNDALARSTSRTGRLLPSFTNAQANPSSKASGSEGRRDSQPIDPLSHQILKRTNTQGGGPSKTRTTLPQESNTTLPESSASVSAGRNSMESSVNRSDTSNSLLKERRNRGSFFSRFAPKKKDLPTGPIDDVSEVGDGRTEGMDADAFSYPIGYVPQFPAPPKYIKVRSHGRKERDFNRVFLAQELKGRSGVEIAQSGGRSLGTATTRPGGNRKDGNAIWAMEFSKDGKYLAAGGKDFAVRVWAVLSSKEDRQSHELDDDNVNKEGESVRLNAPVFKPKTVQEYSGHTASVLDLSWSKNNFLLSSSMDKTVRLWHVSREECLCCFKHSDFVTSIQFHPRDDRFFLAGSLDSKLRLWSIPDKSVAYGNSLPEFITAVAFTPDGKTAIAGCLNGMCLFFDTEGLKYQTQIHVRSAHGKNAKGSKVTGIQAINCPPDDPNGDVRLLITSNDSRIRVYNMRDKGLELKLKGNENSCSQIHASFSDDAKYIICGSEDCKAYIWPTSQPESEKEKRPVEIFEAHSVIVTKAIMAPTKARRLLSVSGDPLYDLCNPPPVTLISRTHSEQSSIPQTEDGRQRPSLNPNPSASDSQKPTKPEESPAYLARCAHPDGNIIITADFNGQIKVFRQDCAFQNRLRNNDSGLSKKMLGRTNSVATRNSNRSRRDSFQINNHSSDRILSWRQSINSTTGSFDSFRNPGMGNNGSLNHKRSVSPRKSAGQLSLKSNTYRQGSQSARIPQSAQFPPAFGSPNPSPSHRSSSGDDAEKKSPMPYLDENHAERQIGHVPLGDTQTNPLMLRGDQSYMFWNRSVYQAQAAAAHSASLLDDQTGEHSGNTSTAASSNASLNEHGGERRLGVPLAREITTVSRLSSEDGSSNGDRSQSRGASGEQNENGAEDQEVKCRRCGGDSFRVRKGGGSKGGRIMECSNCGLAI